MLYRLFFAFLLRSNHEGRSFDRIAGIYVEITVKETSAFADVTLVVVVFVGMSYLFGLNVVSAGNCMPVISRICAPSLSIGMITELRFTYGTEAYVVSIHVLLLCAFGNGVTAGCGMPVVSSVGNVAFCVIGMVAILNVTNSTESVTVRIVMLFFSVCGNYVLTVGKLEPVVSRVVRILGSALGVIAHLVRAYVTDTVVAFNVNVSGYVFNLNAVSAGNCVPVIIFVGSPVVTFIPGVVAHYV